MGRGWVGIGYEADEIARDRHTQPGSMARLINYAGAETVF
jgi:hypothetical protein